MSSLADHAVLGRIGNQPAGNDSEPAEERDLAAEFQRLCAARHGTVPYHRCFLAVVRARHYLRPPAPRMSPDALTQPYLRWVAAHLEDDEQLPWVVAAESVQQFLELRALGHGHASM